MHINTWPFPYQAVYYPNISLLIRDVVKGWYGSRDDYRPDIEKGHVVKYGVESGVFFWSGVVIVGVAIGVIFGVDFKFNIVHILQSKADTKKE
jgi:hypothetical protein